MVTPRHVDTRPVIGSLRTGTAALDLGVLAALGSGRVAWCADPDPHIRSILAARMPDIPNLGDLRTVDWGPSRAGRPRHHRLPLPRHLRHRTTRRHQRRDPQWTLDLGHGRPSPTTTAIHPRGERRRPPLETRRTRHRTRRPGPSRVRCALAKHPRRRRRGATPQGADLHPRLGAVPPRHDNREHRATTSHHRTLPPCGEAHGPRQPACARRSPRRAVTDAHYAEQHSTAQPLAVRYWRAAASHPGEQHPQRRRRPSPMAGPSSPPPGTQDQRQRHGHAPLRRHQAPADVQRRHLQPGVHHPPVRPARLSRAQLRRTGAVAHTPRDRGNQRQSQSTRLGRRLHPLLRHRPTRTTSPHRHHAPRRRQLGRLHPGHPSVGGRPRSARTASHRTRPPGQTSPLRRLHRMAYGTAAGLDHRPRTPPHRSAPRTGERRRPPPGRTRHPPATRRPRHTENTARTRGQPWEVGCAGRTQCCRTAARGPASNDAAAATHTASRS
ncbi:hypothetical protein FHR81_003266 [Actinoalloteichus hoggarensis]|uniref:Uncharacterized protein n=1 Tax=Actinoalloteichus hoggarensis TaxID=1470176 RepID=A0A221W6R5_9PSEU|nr:hypothetical protein AHOG_20020 [Actinoalloteichus hoggarensis]MBB5922214.1 hypothetical protein [Actinoalloteichus hoggarensis]